MALLNLGEGVPGGGKQRLVGDVAQKSMSADGAKRGRIFGFQEIGNHPSDRATQSTGAPDAGKALSLAGGLLAFTIAQLGLGIASKLKKARQFFFSVPRCNA
jgi:hypothetical protein